MYNWPAGAGSNEAPLDPKSDPKVVMEVTRPTGERISAGILSQGGGSGKSQSYQVQTEGSTASILTDTEVSCGQIDDMWFMVISDVTSSFLD